MRCQTSASMESLHLFTIVSDHIYSPIKVGCFPVSHLCTMRDAKTDGWKVLALNNERVTWRVRSSSFTSCDSLKSRKEKKKKTLIAIQEKKSEEKITCHFRSHACC